MLKSGPMSSSACNALNFFSVKSLGEVKKEEVKNSVCLKSTKTKIYFKP